MYMKYLLKINHLTINSLGKLREFVNLLALFYVNINGKGLYRLWVINIFEEDCY